MRALVLTFAVLATSACTQGNTQLPPFYEAGSTGNVDGSVADASEDGTGSGDGEASDAAADGPVGDAPAEASGEGGVTGEAGAESGATDSGGAGD